MNSVTIVSAPEGDRTIVLNTMHAWAPANTDLYAQALAGAAGTLQLTNALGGTPPTGYQTMFNFATLQSPDRSPNVSGRQEVFLNLEMLARKVGGTPELAVTHDADGVMHSRLRRCGLEVFVARLNSLNRTRPVRPCTSSTATISTPTTKPRW